jgi:Mrp family chromosome partitioning ATPase/capsular polysaccharide biosynthesis protein
MHRPHQIPGSSYRECTCDLRKVNARPPIDVRPDRPYSSNVMSDQRTTLMAKMASARRRLWMAAVVAIVAGAAAAALASAQAPTYAASAQVGFGTTTLPAQASVALTPAKARATLHRAHVTSMSAHDLLASTTINVDPPSGVAVIRVTDSRGPRARRLADAYAQTLVSARRHQIANGARRTKAKLHRQLVATTHSLQKAQGVEQVSMRSQYGTLVRLWQAIDTRTSIAMDGVQVIGPAAAATTEDQHVMRDAVLAAIAGALVAIVLLVVTARPGRGRARTARELGRALRMPVLGTLGGSMSDAWEGIGQVRARIAGGNLPQPAAIAVSGAGHEDATADTVVGLALAVARQGRRVTVVDLDVARPRLHRRFGADGAPGAADVVAGRIRIDDGLITFDDRGIQVTDPPFAAGCVSLLPAGALDGSLWDMLSSSALRDVFRRLRRDSDLILVACPPASEPDAVAALADLADGLVVVARLGSLRWDDAAALRSSIESIPMAKLGAVAIAGDAAPAQPSFAPSGRPAPATS